MSTAAAVAIGANALAVVAGAARWGRSWLRTGDGFPVWFGLLAALSPLHAAGGGVEADHADGGGAGGRGRRLRWPAAIAWVQAGAIVVGHVVGVVLAHDRAVALFDARQADRSQRPLVGVMVAYTVGGLALLLGA